MRIKKKLLGGGTYPTEQDVSSLSSDRNSVPAGSRVYELGAVGKQGNPTVDIFVPAENYHRKGRF